MQKFYYHGFLYGSGTVGQACVGLNSKDGGKKYILVCNNESNICENVTSKRLELVSEKYNSPFVYMK